MRLLAVDQRYSGQFDGQKGSDIVRINSEDGISAIILVL